MLGGAGILLGAGPAQAAEVAYKTECIPPPISNLPPVQGTTKVEITAPATAKVGDEVDIVWKTTQAASSNPDVLDLAENTVQPTGTIKLAGGQSGDLKVTGERKNPPIKKNSPMILSDMKGRLKLTAAGEVTLTPDAYNINVNKPISTDTKCTPKEQVKAGATIKVTGAGGSSGGGTSGGTSSGASGGGGDGQTDFPGKEVQTPYKCKTPIGDKDATSPVQINAKKDGGSYGLTVEFKKSVMDSPADIPADSVKPSMEVQLGGADKGTVHVEGPTNKEPIKSGEPMTIPDLTGTYKPGADGKSTLSPGVLTVKALGTTTTCTPVKSDVSLELDTAAQPGGTSGSDGGSPSTGGGSPATGGGSSSSGGGLAETGAEDNGALRALGLIAGTVILLGGAVFTFLPRRRGLR
ncbi:hypothetical protein ACH4D5_19020 [Streptomyces sp. NPDC018029]|uniref:hypothetical protein n=1 Tax=Streptomyces sp. NPDC018029 TaxID=3365032 RepID=UPI003790FF2D